MDITRGLNPGTPPPEGFRLSSPDTWEFFSEGANNILFRYTGVHPYFKPFLLRCRKHLPGAPSTTQLHSYVASKFAPLLGDYCMRTEIIALDPTFIPALNRGLQEAEAGVDWAGRPLGKQRKRRLLDEAEGFALLVEDMSCGNYLYEEAEEDGESAERREEDPAERWKDMATVEFKPKWLVQSPNAPAGWKLCRTCAVRLMNNHRSASSAPEGREYCPLDLSSGDKDRIEAAVLAIVNTQNSVMIADPSPASDDEDEDAMDTREDGAGDADDGEEESGVYNLEKAAHELAQAVEQSLVLLLTRFFRTSPIIPLLSRLQSRFGTRGVFTSATLQAMASSPSLPSEEELAEMEAAAARYAPKVNRQFLEVEEEEPLEEDDIWTAMTLRDCSLFLKIWVRRRTGRGMEARIECKVGDLDLKTGEGGRAVYWRDVERRLRQGAWYLGKDVGRDCRTGEGWV